jgi:hypothetical protein
LRQALVPRLSVKQTDPVGQSLPPAVHFIMQYPPGIDIAHPPRSPPAQSAFALQAAPTGAFGGGGVDASLPVEAGGGVESSSVGSVSVSVPPRFFPGNVEEQAAAPNAAAKRATPSLKRKEELSVTIRS